MGGFRRMLSVRKSLRWRLTIAFAVMAVLPILTMLYLLTVHVPAHSRDIYQLGTIFLSVIFLVVAGYLMIHQILEKISGLSRQARIMAGGEYDIKALLRTEDELRDIAESVNTMTRRMQDYVQELHEYGERTAMLDEKIRKAVFTLTNLIKAGEMISSGEKLENISDFIAASVCEEMEGGFAAIFQKDEAGRYRLESLSKEEEEPCQPRDLEDKLPGVEELLSLREYVLLDNHPQREYWQKDERRRMGYVNAIFFPIISSRGTAGILAAGRTGKDVVFNENHVEIMRIFGTQMTLAYRSAETKEKIHTLEMLDPVTGAYSPAYMRSRLEDEVARAVFYQRPCSVIVVNVDDVGGNLIGLGEHGKKQVLKDVVKFLEKFCPITGKVGVLGPMEFGIILPEINKRESMEICEAIKYSIEKKAFGPWSEGVLSAGIGLGENPIDGPSGDSILSIARKFADRARKKGVSAVISSE